MDSQELRVEGDPTADSAATPWEPLSQSRSEPAASGGCGGVFMNHITLKCRLVTGIGRNIIKKLPAVLLSLGLLTEYKFFYTISLLAGWNPASCRYIFCNRPNPRTPTWNAQGFPNPYSEVCSWVSPSEMSDCVPNPCDDPGFPGGCQGHQRWNRAGKGSAY